MQQDSFYDHLPFTLQEEHLNPDCVIFGTGLKQSAIAAHLAKIQNKKVLVFDQQKTYGSSLKTITLKELFQLNNNQLAQRLYSFVTPLQYVDLNSSFQKSCHDKKNFRGYNIDIQPTLFFGNSLACECLKQADMDKYTEFRLVANLLKYEKGKLEPVPLSKGKIFEDKNLSLFQKKNLLTTLHTLIKVYHRHMKIEQDQNSTKEFDKGFGKVSEETMTDFNQNKENNFVEFLSKITKKNKKIMDFICYIVCNYQYNYSRPIPGHAIQSYKLRNFIQKFGKFIDSCGIYGQSPYLYVDNGVGDIPQAYSRIASIFGSTFILHPKLQINEIHQIQGQLSIKSNIAPGMQIKTKQILYGETFVQLYRKNNGLNQNLETQHCWRALLLCRKLGSEEECPSIGSFIDLQNLENPVYMFMFDDSTHGCPQGHVLYQFSTIIEVKTMQKEVQIVNGNKQLFSQNDFLSLGLDKKLQLLIEKLSEVRGNQFKSSILYVTSYIRTNIVGGREGKQTGENEQGLLKSGISLDLDNHFQEMVRVVGKKENYFRKKNPYHEEEEEDDQSHNLILEQLQNLNINSPQTHHLQKSEETKNGQGLISSFSEQSTKLYNQNQESSNQKQENSNQKQEINNQNQENNEAGEVNSQVKQPSVQVQIIQDDRKSQPMNSISQK